MVVTIRRWSLAQAWLYLPFFSGCSDKHRSPWLAEVAVSQDQDRRHLHPPGRSHPQDPQQRIDVTSFQECYTRRLECHIISRTSHYSKTVTLSKTETETEIQPKKIVNETYVWRIILKKDWFILSSVCWNSILFGPSMEMATATLSLPYWSCFKKYTVLLFQSKIKYFQEIH